MTNFDPGGILLLLTVIPAVLGGAISIALAHGLARFRVGAYESNVTVVVAVLILAWIVAAAFVSTSMLTVLAVTLSMVGAYAVTRDVTATSYGWALGVVLLFAVFVVLSNLGVYRGVDATGRPQGLIAQNFFAFYATGLLVCGAIAGKVVALVRAWVHGGNRRGSPDESGRRPS